MWCCLAFVVLCGFYGIVIVDPRRGPGQGPYCMSTVTNRKMINLALGGVTWQMTTFENGSCLHTVCLFPQIRLTILAFLFLNMATLTVLYTILFCFPRKQTRRLLAAHESSRRETGQTSNIDDPNLGESWQSPSQAWELGSASGEGKAFCHPNQLCHNLHSPIPRPDPGNRRPRSK